MFFSNDKQFIVLHETPGERKRIFPLAVMLANEPLGDVVVDGLLSSGCCKRTYLAAPAAWELKTAGRQKYILSCNGHIPLDKELLQDKSNSYLILSNGKFYANVNYPWLRKAVQSFDADVVLVNIEPKLAAGREKLRLTSQGQLAGIRRVYDDSAQRSPMPTAWPCHVFIRTSCLWNIFGSMGIPISFDNFIETASGNASVCSISVGAALLDIETPEGLLTFVAKAVKSSRADKKNNYGFAMTREAICHGEVISGQNIRIGENVKLIGPVIICSNTDIGDNVIVARSVIGSGVSISPRETIHDSLLLKLMNGGRIHEFRQHTFTEPFKSGNNFRMWPSLSYARFVKRLADVVIAAVVLIFFAPVIAIIALLTKATSRGPVFFGHLRQGLHGKNFRCFKFRSMIVGADDLQAKLRTKNEVDGPQFKIEDDPRVTPLGKFLRDTYLDEIPQFFNVLMGDMSVIGPRPSPEAENSLCAHWRDARLSVRPGITGLWQVCRTRKTGSDFQEWVYYDLQYVRQLSFTLDLRIFWKTTRHLIKMFLKQF